MAKTTVVNIRTNKYDVYIGRCPTMLSIQMHDDFGGLFGNPYIIGRDGGRDKVIDLHRGYFYKRIQVDSEFAIQVEKLRGKKLGCFCAPRSCHGDVIAEYLNGNQRNE